MNKRQKKKQYKKVYGFNPPITKERSNWTEAISKAIHRVKKILNDIWKTLISGIEIIQTMPDEEFEEKLRILTEEQKKMAWEIRNKGKRKNK